MIIDVVLFIGLFNFFSGISFLLSPAAWRWSVLFRKRWWYQLGMVSVLSAICLIVAAPEARWPWVIIGISTLYLLDGFGGLATASGRDKMIEEMLNEGYYQWVTAVVCLAIGLTVILAFK